MGRPAAVLPCSNVAGCIGIVFHAALCERDDLRAFTCRFNLPVARCVFGLHELAIMRKQHVTVGMAHFESEGRGVVKLREMI